MSYNRSYGSSGSLSSSNRDRDRQRAYYPRYGESQDRYNSSSSYQDNQQQGSYRRPDSREHREYYGYRSGYNRNNNPGGNNTNSQSQNSNRRRRQGDKYDSYQGSKYRPPVSGRGRSSNSPNHQAGHSSGMSGSLSWNAANNSNDSSHYSSKQYDDSERAEERRRKPEWDHKMSGHVHSNQRDQFKPEMRHSETEKAGLHRLGSDDMVAAQMAKTKSELDVHKPEKESKSPVIKDEKLLHLFGDSESNTQLEAGDKESTTKPEIDVREKDNFKEREPKKEPENAPAEAGPSKNDHHEPKDAVPDSPVPTADTSVLSPVGLPVSDTRVITGLQDIAENEKSAQEDVSDAETVITEGQAPLDAARKLIRRSSPDEGRTKLKRKVIFDSDEEDEADKPVDDGKTPTITRSPSPNIPRLDSEDELDDSQNDGKKSRRKDYKIKRDSTGRSLLQRACKKGDLAEVKSLIERGADANESDFGGFTCLHEAALAGHNEIVEFLIEKGANVNKQALEFGDFETPLMDAAENKHIETVKILLKHGADPDICNADGYSALTKLYHLQEEEDDYKEIIELLDASSENSGSSRGPHSPRKIVEDPAENYFNDLVKKKSSATIFKYLAQGLKELAAGDFVTHAYSLQKTPDVLNVAARNGHVELVDILLGLNPGPFDINQKNRIGLTVLLASVGRGHYDVVKFLLTKGADPKMKREKDGLNALQIARHSAQHDPREMMLLERYVNGNIEQKSETPGPVLKPSTDDAVHENASKRENKDKKRRAPEDESRHVKKAKSKLKENLVETKEPKEPKEAKVLFHSEVSDDEQREPEEKKEKQKQSSPGPKSEHARQDSPPVEDSKKKKDSASASPAPLTKAQEEQRIKAAEEAKLWQEKVQAKKRARKEMFLLAEKEKEKKRKEDEEKKIVELKQQKEKEIEDKLKEEQKAHQLAQEMEKKRLAMEIYSIIQRYPIGLQEASFDGSISDKERLKYSPVYVFSHDGEQYVVDLQIALLLAAPVSEVHQHCQSKGRDISVAAKDEMWPLFFPMVGLGKHDRIDKNGRAKFASLQLNYLKLSEVILFIREQYPEVESLIWKNDKVTYVQLAEHPERMASVDAKELPKLATNSFVPPKLKKRVDVVRTICSANTPLW